MTKKANQEQGSIKEEWWKKYHKTTTLWKMNYAGRHLFVIHGKIRHHPLWDHTLHHTTETVNKTLSELWRKINCSVHPGRKRKMFVSLKKYVPKKVFSSLSPFQSSLFLPFRLLEDSWVVGERQFSPPLLVLKALGNPYKKNNLHSRRHINVLFDQSLKHQIWNYFSSRPNSIIYNQISIVDYINFVLLSSWWVSLLSFLQLATGQPWLTTSQS